MRIGGNKNEDRREERDRRIGEKKNEDRREEE
jgi:hypothetical protein